MVPVAIVSAHPPLPAAVGAPPPLPRPLVPSRAAATPTGVPQLGIHIDPDLDLGRQHTPAGVGAGAHREAALGAPTGDAATTAGERGVAGGVVGITAHHLDLVGDILVAAVGQQEGEGAQATAHTAPGAILGVEAQEGEGAGVVAPGLGVEAEEDVRVG